METERQCRRCGLVKPITSFDVSQSIPVFYRRRTCRDCRGVDKRRDALRRGDTERYRRKRAARMANEASSAKQQARFAVQAAVKAGRMLRQPCEVCGAAMTHGHHDDYSKPLEVRWLCPEHHKAHHDAMKAKEQAA